MSGLNYPQIPVEKLVELCSRSLYSIDGLWFTAIEQEYGFDVALKLDIEIWRKFAKIHARRLVKAFAIEEDTPIRTLVKMLKVDPMMAIYEPEIGELADNRAVLRCTNCPPQKARIRDGRGEYSCKSVGVVLFSSYAQVADPGIKLSCLVCPPDPHPPQYWCEWQFEI